VFGSNRFCGCWLLTDAKTADLLSNE